MTIYPARNAQGDYTGSWTVEVMRQGKRTRATASDFSAAKQIERALEVGQPVPSELLAPKVLQRKAAVKQRALYKLRELAEESSRRCEVAPFV